MKSFFMLAGKKIERTAALAPMAGVTDRAFRLLCKEQGAAMVTSEMASCMALLMNDRKTAELISVDDALRPMSIQIFGHDPVTVGRSIEKVLPFAPDFIDLNMGCPAPKVTGPGAGSALMKDPEKAERILKAAVSNSPLPVSVKMRLGWEEKAGAVDFAKRMEDNGAAFLCVHGRTRVQMYSGTADWTEIARIKQAVHIPVIANGDIATPEDAKSCYDQTGCDLVAVGRGARGNPFLFAQIRTYLEDGVLLPPPGGAVRADTLRRLFALMQKDRPLFIALREIRKFAAWFLTGLPHAAKMRARAHAISTEEDFSSFCADLSVLC